jgi:hypothetical protein
MAGGLAGLLVGALKDGMMGWADLGHSGWIPGKKEKNRKINLEIDF